MSREYEIFTSFRNPELGIFLTSPYAPVITKSDEENVEEKPPRRFQPMLCLICSVQFVVLFTNSHLCECVNMQNYVVVLNGYI